MGTTVLDSRVPIQAGLHVYAHCLRGMPGGVALLAINTDKVAARSLSLPTAAQRYTLSSPAADLLSRTVQLEWRGSRARRGRRAAGALGQSPHRAASWCSRRQRSPFSRFATPATAPVGG